MIRYLEQLERDLVEAIDRREAEQPRRRHRRRWPRPDWSPVVAAAALLLTVAAAVVVVHPRRGEERPVAPPPRGTVQPQRPAPIPPRTALRLVGTVTRVAPATWRGQARGPGRSGTLTITGSVNLDPRPCCEAPQANARSATHTILFTWTTADGSVSGCIANTIYRRPHARFVWDGVGRVTSATGTLRRYRGRGAGIAGRTATSTPDEARIILSTGAPPGHC